MVIKETQYSSLLRCELDKKNFSKIYTSTKFLVRPLSRTAAVSISDNSTGAMFALLLVGNRKGQSGLVFMVVVLFINLYRI